MHTTGRSEGVNAFFKDYVNSNTSLKDFVEKLEQASMRIESRERAEDYDSEQKYRLVDVVASEPDKYIVKFKRGTGTDHWVVQLNPSTFEGVCECHYFEFVGLPCAHLMKVFTRLDLDEIPEYFIKKRWLKGANRFRVDDKAKKATEKQTGTMRFSHLCREATQWACVAYQSEEGYKLFLEGIRALGEQISQLSISKGENEETPIMLSSEEIPEQSQIVLDPNVSQTKGRHKELKENKKTKTNARYKRPIEVAQEKKGRKCAICGSAQNHDKRNCPKKFQLNNHGTSAEMEK